MTGIPSDPHRNDELAQLHPSQVTPELFLKAIFGPELYQFAHVTGFPDDPSAITKERRGICWKGGWYGARPDVLTQPGWNGYFTISLFHDADGAPVRARDKFLAMYVVMIDDVGTEKIAQEALDRLPLPSYRLRTSPGNEQWGYIMLVAETSQGRANLLLDGLVLQGLSPDGTDPGMRGVTRYGRTPWAWNTKAKYRDAEGRAFRTELIEWRPDRLYTLEQLADPLGIDLSTARDLAPGGGGLGEASAWPDDAPVMQWISENYLGEKRGTEGQYHVVCPWVDEHSDDDDSGTWLITHEDGSLGFKCHHGHCQARNGADFLRQVGLRGLHDDWRTRWTFGKQLAQLQQGGAPAQGPTPALPSGGSGGAGEGGAPIDFFGPAGAAGVAGSEPAGTPGWTDLVRSWLVGMPLDPGSPEGTLAIYEYLQRLHEIRPRPTAVQQRLALLALKDHFPGNILTLPTLERQSAQVASDLAARRLAAAAAGGEADDDSPEAQGLRALSQYIYVTQARAFYHRPSGVLVSADGLDTVLDHLPFHAAGGQPGPDGMPPRISPRKAWASRPDKQVADVLGWWPGRGDHFGCYVEAGRRICNTYEPPSLAPIAYDRQDPMIRLLEGLFQHIYGQYAHLARQHMAYTLRYPALKIRWQWLVVGDARIGKSLTTLPLKRILGRSARVIEPHDIDSGWGDMWLHAKALFVEEVYRPRDLRWTNALKSKLANDDIMVLNVKGGGIVEQANVVAMWLFSNEEDAMLFDLGDDKLMVIEAHGYLPGCTAAESAHYLGGLADWLKTDIGAGQAYQWLLDTDLTGFTPNRLPVRTEAYHKMAEISRPDYAQAVDDWIDSRQPPFDIDVVRLDEIKVALQRIGHRFSNHELTKALKRAGWAQYRGERRVDSDRSRTPRFWAPERLCGTLTPGDLYDLYQERRSMPGGAVSRSGGDG